MRTWSLKRVYLHLGPETCLGKLLERQSLGMLLLSCLTIISNEWETRDNMGSETSLFMIRTLFVNTDGVFSVHHCKYFYAVGTLSKLDPFKERKYLR